MLRTIQFDISTLTKYKYFGGAILFLFVPLFYLFDFSLDPKWFYGSYAYEKLNEPIWGIFYRFFILVLSTIMGFAFLSIIPKGKMFFTKIGKNTMNIYVWHFLLLDILTSSGFYKTYKEFISMHHFLMFMVFFVASILIMYVLSSTLSEKYLSLHKLPILKILKKVNNEKFK